MLTLGPPRQRRLTTETLIVTRILEVSDPSTLPFDLHLLSSVSHLRFFCLTLGPEKEWRRLELRCPLDVILGHGRGGGVLVCVWSVSWTSQISLSIPSRLPRHSGPRRGLVNPLRRPRSPGPRPVVGSLVFYTDGEVKIEGLDDVLPEPPVVIGLWYVYSFVLPRIKIESILLSCFGGVLY